MAVLAEAVSVIAPVATIRLRLAGGMAAFQALVPNESFACDGEVARVGFMASEDAVGFMAVLQGLGFWFVHNGQAVALVLVERQTGADVYRDRLTGVLHLMGRAGPRR